MTRNLSTATIVERLKRAKVVVVGDIMLDRFVEGVVDRISPEAPIPVFCVRHETSMLGAAGNVLRNLATLGSEVYLAAIVGVDASGSEVLDLVAKEGQSIAGLHDVPGRRTAIKTRYIAAGQQMLRADRETVEAVPDIVAGKIMAAVARELEDAGALLLSDYGKGVLTIALIESLIGLAREAGRPVIVDPKGTDYSRYAGASLVTPNCQELTAATGLPAGDDEAVVAAGYKLVESSGVGAVLVTRSEQGMTLVDKKSTHHFPARAREVYDVAGAGDTVAAAVAAAIAAGTSLGEAAQFANIAAGVVVGKIGTAVARPEEILAAALENDWSDAEAKVLPASAAAERVGAWRRQGRKIGFTNGCFDLLHPGHVSLIAQARRNCDCLVVGLNSDASVTGLKGEDRPVQNEASRAAVLASLGDVDAVVVFAEDTPRELIRALKPDVLVKGADYTLEQVVGAEDVKSWGGQVVLAELLEGHSTTATLRRLGAK